MKKDLFKNDPVLGKEISQYLVENAKSLQSIFVVLEHYFTSKLYSEIGTTAHEHTSVCTLTFSPVLHKKNTQLMLGIENGHLSKKDEKGGFIKGATNEDLCKKFFKEFLNAGLSLSFETDLFFFNRNPLSDKKSLIKRKQSFRVSFDLRYFSANEPFVHNLSVTRYKWNLTTTEQLT